EPRAVFAAGSAASNATQLAGSAADRCKNWRRVGFMVYPLILPGICVVLTAASVYRTPWPSRRWGRSPVYRDMRPGPRPNRTHRTGPWTYGDLPSTMNTGLHVRRWVLLA